jgi:hypothetical protein
LQGWSNGGSATLATMSDSAPGITAPTPSTGFRAGVLSRLRIEGAVSRRDQTLRARAGASGIGRRGSLTAPLRRPRRQKPGDRWRHPVPALSGRDARFRRSQSLASERRGQRIGDPGRDPARDCVLRQCAETVAPYNPLIIPALIRSRLKRLASVPSLQS